MIFFVFILLGFPGASWISGLIFFNNFWKIYEFHLILSLLFFWDFMTYVLDHCIFPKCPYILFWEFYIFYLSCCLDTFFLWHTHTRAHVHTHMCTYTYVYVSDLALVINIRMSSHLGVKWNNFILTRTSSSLVSTTDIPFYAGNAFILIMSQYNTIMFLSLLSFKPPHSGLVRLWPTNFILSVSKTKTLLFLPNVDHGSSGLQCIFTSPFLLLGSYYPNVGQESG